MTVLYHYTSPAALCGILQNGELWASEYRFLNDSREFIHGVDVFREALKRHKAKPGVAIASEVFDRIDALTDFFLSSSDARHSQRVFLVSLTSEPDLLSQWRGYNGGAGFCIGLQDDWLRALARRQGFVLSQVLYKAAEQEAAMDQLFANLRKATEHTSLPKGDLFATVNEWWRAAVSQVAILKDASFSEECESRLVRSTSTWPVDMSFRQNAGGLVPFTKFKLEGTATPEFTTRDNNLGFVEIVVGPALSDRQIVAVDALLASKHMRFGIRKSTIPYVTV